MTHCPSRSVYRRRATPAPAGTATPRTPPRLHRAEYPSAPAREAPRDRVPPATVPSVALALRFPSWCGTWRGRAKIWFEVPASRCVVASKSASESSARRPGGETCNGATRSRTSSEMACMTYATPANFERAGCPLRAFRRENECDSHPLRPRSAARHAEALAASSARVRDSPRGASENHVK
jgi:hypothetical protein